MLSQSVLYRSSTSVYSLPNGILKKSRKSMNSPMDTLLWNNDVTVALWTDAIFVARNTPCIYFGRSLKWCVVFMWELIALLIAELAYINCNIFYYNWKFVWKTATKLGKQNRMTPFKPKCKLYTVPFGLGFTWIHLNEY